MTLVLGIDLAWGESTASRPANETGVAAVDELGRVLDAGWTVGVGETVTWIQEWATDDTLVMVDAPLVITNASGQRACETQVGRFYGRAKVSANSTNLASPRKAGVQLLAELEALGWGYSDGFTGPPKGGRTVSECYPYATIVGAAVLAYAERPRYKRAPKGMRAAPFRVLRQIECDGLIRRLASVDSTAARIDFSSHAETRKLLVEPSPLADKEYKHREDLIDALICAWTGHLWLSDADGMHVLGVSDGSGRSASIIAPKPHTSPRWIRENTEIRRPTEDELAIRESIADGFWAGRDGDPNELMDQAGS